MVDFAAEGLLDGLDGAAREARLRLLEALHADGASLEELKAAVGDDTLFLLPAERLIGGQTRYTPAEVAELSGVPAEFLADLRRAQGLPVPDRDDRELTEADLEAARLVRTFWDAGLDPDDMLEVTRILGRALSQAAEAMRRMTLRLVLEPGADEHDLAVRYAEAAAQLEPLTAPMLGHMLNLHLRHAVRTELLEAAERQTGQMPGARDVAVGFADLVGFTRLGEEVDPGRLGAVAGRLEALASEVVTLPVRVVKTIGDAVMLVSPDADALLEAALTLVEAADAEGEDFPQLRCGLAYGPALQRAGDWYGRPVNLASRLTTIARPASVLCSPELREAASGPWTWSFAGERRVRGVRGSIKVYRARRPREDDQAAA
ncbi:MAG TPA: adenylate cyclase regulatory domain-containing protein [Capillimicrobium sp.]|nr:adenylate cyclase regulatory domain-containing protein [Capillimicrobium sp.]